MASLFLILVALSCAPARATVACRAAPPTLLARAARGPAPMAMHASRNRKRKARKKGGRPSTANAATPATSGAGGSLETKLLEQHAENCAVACDRFGQVSAAAAEPVGWDVRQVPEDSVSVGNAPYGTRDLSFAAQ